MLERFSHLTAHFSASWTQNYLDVMTSTVREFKAEAKCREPNNLHVQKGYRVEQDEGYHSSPLLKLGLKRKAQHRAAFHLPISVEKYDP